MAATVKSEDVTGLNSKQILRMFQSKKLFRDFIGLLEKQWVREPVPPGLTVIKLTLCPTDFTFSKEYLTKQVFFSNYPHWWSVHIYISKQRYTIGKRPLKLGC